MKVEFENNIYDLSFSYNTQSIFPLSAVNQEDEDIFIPFFHGTDGVPENLLKFAKKEISGFGYNDSVYDLDDNYLIHWRFDPSNIIFKIKRSVFLRVFWLRCLICLDLWEIRPEMIDIYIPKNILDRGSEAEGSYIEDQKLIVRQAIVKAEENYPEELKWAKNQITNNPEYENFMKNISKS